MSGKPCVKIFGRCGEIIMSLRAIIFVGSSILEQWNDLPQALLGMPIINKAVGGTRTWEIHDIIMKDVVPLNPAVLCYYGGSNDINSGETAENIIARTTATIESVFAMQPGLFFVYFSIIRAPQKQDRWEDVDAINASLTRLEERFQNFHVLNLNPVFFDNEGRVLHELFVEDGLHLTDIAYKKLGALVYPYLEHISVD